MLCCAVLEGTACLPKLPAMEPEQRRALAAVVTVLATGQVLAKFASSSNDEAPYIEDTVVEMCARLRQKTFVQKNIVKTWY